MRGLSPDFMNDLKNGLLSPILEMVKRDSTLCLEIRENYINIYYRGGNILRVTKTPNGYLPYFDNEYLKYSSWQFPVNMPQRYNSSNDVYNWLEVIPYLKHAMDLWITQHPRDEREFQQLLVRENNFNSTARGTDYFICDMEYASNVGRFDMVAVYWPSSAAERKNNKNIGLAFIEMKYMDGALSGKSGLCQHIADMNSYLANQNNVTDIKDEMKTVFNQKLELGLIRNQKEIQQFSNDTPEYIIILVNHDPDSSILRTELQKLPPHPHLDLKFAVSNFMGYGLYQQNIYSLDQFLVRFRGQI